MGPTVAVFGTNGGTSFSAYGFDNALTRIGMNTGNAIFQFALWEMVANPKLAINPGMTAEYIRANAQHILIPAANQVNAAWDMGWLADMLERCNLPVTCIGLGAQAGTDSDPRLDLKPGTVRYLRVLSERAGCIGLRGPFTQQVLEHFGVTNTVITGCPSQTINPQLSGATIQAQLDIVREMPRPSVGYVLGTLEADTRLAERTLAQQIALLPHIIILQTDPRLLRIIHDRRVPQDDMAYVKWVQGIMRPDLNIGDFIEYFLRQAVFYSDARTWIDKMRSYDIVLGMRIHGAVTAIQAGKLGVCVSFDSRTKELAQTMGYPYLPMDRIRNDQTIGQMLEHVIFDADRFDEARNRNTNSIYNIIKQSGLSLN